QGERNGGRDRETRDTRNTERIGFAELCHRHRLITNPSDWPPLSDKSNPLTMIESKWGCTTGELPDGPVFDLARRFGELGLGAVPKILFKDGEMPQCSCQGAHGPAPAGMGHGDDPTETSDALLVLEGLGTGDMSGAFSLSSFQAELTRQMEGVAGEPCPSAHGEAQRADQCVSAPRTPTSRGSDGEKTLKVPGKSRKGSLKIRLSKLFRTKSCSGSNSLLDKRPSVAYSVSSAGSLMDMNSCLFSGITLFLYHFLSHIPSLSLSRSFFPFLGAGETVSLVDVDISRRGANTPHPPTPPPPPRRSLSLLGTLPPFFLSVIFSMFFLSFSLCCGWYWGPMNWEDAEMKLKGKPDGAFLVRDSSDPRYILSLSFRSQGVTHHTRMEHYRGTFSLWCHPKFEDRCHSVVEFIERAIMHSKNGKFLYFLRSRVPGLPPTPVQLLYPVSRFSNVKSLQHLCRFCIRQMVRIDHIQELPLPKPLIMYLRKFYYYDAEEEMYLPIKSIRPAAGVEQEAESQT
uniref:Suppressor of cytokine signaling 7 n=1 Tax=Hucho hucho TaxID=62062 RepID=A0A4W5RRM4_9TELE